MTERLHADVAIVGGGIVGCAAALALRGMQRTVVLLERDLCGSRSSGVNFGGVRRQGRAPCQLPLSQRAHAIWGRLASLIGTDVEYIRCGHFKIARSEEELASLERYSELTREFDLRLEIISGKGLRERCDWLGPDVVGGSLCPDDGQVNPRLVGPAFAAAARRAGARLFERTPVEDVAHDGRDFVLSCQPAGIEVRAPVLLNCAGAWAQPLAQQFGDDVPMLAGHPVMAVTEPLPFFMQWGLGVEGGGLYCRQVARGNVVFGGGRQAHETAEGDVRFGAGSLENLCSRAAELLPRLRHAHVIRSWSGTEGYLPDRQPVLGPSVTTPGLFHAFGFSGSGFQIGPAAGEVLAELAVHGKSTTPIEAFSAGRFVL